VHVSKNPIQQRLLNLGGEIATTPPEELAFQHSVLTQCALPVSQPPEGMLSWERQQGRARLLVEAGKALHPKTGQYVQLGLPYGPKARLLLIHLNTEAVRRQSPIIPIEDTMTAFFRRLMGGKTQDGRTANLLKAQLSALAAATFRMGIADSDRSFQMNTQVVHAFDMWLSREDNQRVFWPSVLKLSADYYDNLTRFAVPLDERAISALAHSALALDIYGWLAQRLHRIPEGKPQFVTWAALHEQFGQDYTRIRKFREFFLAMLRQVRSAYPDAKFEVDEGGMTLFHSEPPVRKRLVMVGGTESPGAL
jgi:hypothetical protein